MENTLHHHTFSAVATFGGEERVQLARHHIEGGVIDERLRDEPPVDPRRVGETDEARAAPPEGCMRPVMFSAWGQCSTARLATTATAATLDSSLVGCNERQVMGGDTRWSASNRGNQWRS
jgi:hypothetical protein